MLSLKNRHQQFQQSAISLSVHRKLNEYGQTKKVLHVSDNRGYDVWYLGCFGSDPRIKGQTMVVIIIF